MNATKIKLGRSFAFFNTTQFLGALNDNIFKILIVLFLTSKLLDPGKAGTVTATAQFVFAIPFLLFSAYAGKLADRFSKRNIIVTVKVAEIVIMTLGCAAIIYGNQHALYGVLFLMATQSAFFGPSKYGIVPELVTNEQLSKANGFLEAMTYCAIVIGTAIGGLLAYMTSARFEIVAIVCLVIAITGLLTAFPIKRTATGQADIKPSVLFIRDIWRTIWSIHRREYLILAVIASAYFMLIGAFIYNNLIPYGIQNLDMDANLSGLLFVLAAVGIAVGALVAGRLSGRNVEIGIVPLAALGLAFSAMALGTIGNSFIFALVLTLLMGISAGMFIVPIYAFIQLRSPTHRRGRILAASNFLGWVGVIIASGLNHLFGTVLNFTAAQNFILLGFMTLIMAVITVILLPDFLVRFICFVLTRLCYRIKIDGIENIPTEGPALLVCNHASWVDPLFLNATLQRRIRFVMDKEFYNNKWLNPIARLMRAIPISADDPPKKILTSLKQARDAMDDGYLVCIFAEGALTRNGMLLSFKSGFERIMKGRDYQIIPAYIGGAWGSIFSYYYGKPLATLPKKFPYPISIQYGRAMPADSSAQQIRQQVAELSCDYFDSLKPHRRSIAEHFVQVARKNWRRRCISDSTGKNLNYGKTLISTIALAAELDKITQNQEKVGIMLPPSVAGAITNLALTMSRKVTVNLNYVTSQQTRISAIEQCNIKTVITSRSFIEKSGAAGNLPGIVFIEDIVEKIKPSAKFKAYLKARFVPRSVLTNAKRFNADDLLTIIFSSGSSGNPRGVMLSHHNVISNIEALRTVFKLYPDDNLCAVLPFFHSFGFTCSLWLPVISGVSASYVPNPLDGITIGKSIRENHSTILFAAPTFLLNYIRRAVAEDFVSLRAVVVGAEKLKKRIADAFEDKFAIAPLEGYGSTELSPVAALNLPDIESDGVLQIGNKPGTVGHPIPGVAVMIIDIETQQSLPLGEAGLLFVKGPNVMLGYLNNEKQTTDVIQNRWYNTGDIASIDEDGFLTIRDRFSRFSKIAGEMVPHLIVEDIFLRELNTSEQLVAVTSVPEPKKGEELVVLYVEGVGNPDKLREIIKKSELPNMWKPHQDNYILIKQMPVLGSGKLDIVKLKKIAADAKKIEPA